ncbi:MAG: RNA pseudouridine synthase [Silvanigrellales bacterium]|jgi:tRNA pseudouridine32 synthase/23S rRNA pseudouridine746 synthase|nr:RNA pseudouridine synthase [Silvanigrellales bacterium]
MTPLPVPHIVFRNERFVLVDKPCDWLSVPSRLGSADARPCVGKWLETALGVRLFPVHRLDEPVSGLLLFALDAQSHRAANAWFEKGLVKKCYEAWTETRSVAVVADVTARTGKEPPRLPDVGTKVQWRSRLAKGKKRAYANETQGKECVTEAILVESSQAQSAPYSRWLLWPITGRSHQLRFELHRHGCPIFGDKLYGSAMPWALGIALRVFEIDFGNCNDASSFGLPSAFRTGGLERPS